MEKELINVGKFLNISYRDVRVIYDIILNFSNCNYSELKILMLKVFSSDIRPEHYIILGHLIGYCLATGEAQDKTTNYLSLCLRQN